MNTHLATGDSYSTLRAPGAAVDAAAEVDRDGEVVGAAGDALR
jgi:hypothetical protein